MRLKVRFDIRNLLVRGVTLLEGVGGKEREVWCPLVYEFLPDFCYICGRIGHTDKQCSVSLPPGSIQQFSKKLRFLLERPKIIGSRRPGSFGWSGGSGSRGGSGSWGLRSRDGGGIDGPSWRREPTGKEDKNQDDKEQEVTSPLKLAFRQEGDDKEKSEACRKLELAGSVGEREIEGGTQKKKDSRLNATPSGAQEKGKDVDQVPQEPEEKAAHSSMQPMQVDVGRDVDARAALKEKG